MIEREDKQVIKEYLENALVDSNSSTGIINANSEEKAINEIFEAFQEDIKCISIGEYINNNLSNIYDIAK